MSVIAIRIVAEAGISRRSIAVDENGGHADKPVRCQIRWETERAERIGSAATVGVLVLRESVACEAERRVQQSRRIEGMRVVHRERVTGGSIGPRRAGIDEIVEATPVYVMIVPLLGILGGQHILRVEALIDLDLHFGVGGVIGSRACPVVLRSARWGVRRRKHVDHLLRHRIDQIAGRIGQLIDRARQFGISKAGVGADVVVGNGSAAHGQTLRGVIHSTIGIPKLSGR